MRLDQGVALITGAGSGLGRGLACALARAGMTVTAIDREEGGLVSLTEELQRENLAIAWEVSDVADAHLMHAKVAALESRLGPVDLVIANAGIGRQTSALDFRPEDLSDLLQVNLMGVANTIAAVLPRMIQRRSGHIVGISSLASMSGLPGMYAYCASKAGVNALLESLRLEVEAYGIAVTTICPGWMRTPMNADMKDPPSTMVELDAAVAHVLKAIRRRRRFHAFPWSAAWGLRLLPLLPGWLRDRLLRWNTPKPEPAPTASEAVIEQAKPGLEVVVNQSER